MRDHADHFVSEERMKELQATWEVETAATANFLAGITPTPDATATADYIYTHMDEFASPLAYGTPVP